MARAKSTKATESTKVTEFTKVTESKKTNQPMQPEQNFKRSFTPLFSKKDGKAQLTFAGYKHSVRKDGNGAFLKIVFSCLDVTGKNPQNISVLSSYKYSEKNVLGKLLDTMGYEHETNEVIIDADDEFGTFIEDNFDAIYDYLDEQKGLIFKATLTLDPKDENFHRIDVLSLEPCFDKSGNQKRAYLAEEGISEKDLDIDIEASGGDNE